MNTLHIALIHHLLGEGEAMGIHKESYLLARTAVGEPLAAAWHTRFLAPGHAQGAG